MKKQKMNEQPAFNYESIDPGYYDKVFRLNKGSQSLWHRMKFKGVGSVLASTGYSNLLDIACGPGTFISTLPSDKKCIGVDIAEKQIAYAKTENASEFHTFMIADVTRLPFDDNSFDVITSLEFIEHIPMDVIHAMLKEVRRCLKPEGRFIVTTPNYRSLWPLLEWIVSKVSPVDYSDQHITKFKRPSLKKLLKEHGFEISRMKSYLLIAPFLAMFGKRLAYLFFSFEFRCLPWGNSILTVVRKQKTSGEKNT